MAKNMIERRSDSDNRWFPEDAISRSDLCGDDPNISIGWWDEHPMDHEGQDWRWLPVSMLNMRMVAFMLQGAKCRLVKGTALHNLGVVVVTDYRSNKYLMVYGFEGDYWLLELKKK